MRAYCAALPAAFVVLASCLAEQAGSHSGADPESGHAHVRGHVFHKSDVATIPDSPYSSGAVLVLSGSGWERRLPAGQGDPRQPGAGALLQEEVFADVVSAWQALDEDGKFLFELPAGEHGICVANLGEPHAPPPALVHGCTAVHVAAGDVVSIAFGFGEGGLETTIEK